MIIFQRLSVSPDLAGLGDDFAMSDGLAGDVAADRVVAAAAVVIDADVVVVKEGVVCGRRLLRSSLSFKEMTDDDEDELAWFDLKWETIYAWSRNENQGQNSRLNAG